VHIAGSGITDSICRYGNLTIQQKHAAATESEPKCRRSRALPGGEETGWRWEVHSPRISLAMALKVDNCFQPVPEGKQTTSRCPMNTLSPQWDGHVPA